MFEPSPSRAARSLFSQDASNSRIARASMSDLRSFTRSVLTSMAVNALSELVLRAGSAVRAAASRPGKAIGSPIRARIGGISWGAFEGPVLFGKLNIGDQMVERYLSICGKRVSGQRGHTGRGEKRHNRRDEGGVRVRQRGFECRSDHACVRVL